MKVGSLASNPNKIRILTLLARKSIKKEEIAKKSRLPLQTVENLLLELTAENFICKEGELYGITENGEKALRTLHEDTGGKRKY